MEILPLPASMRLRSGVLVFVKALLTQRLSNSDWRIFFPLNMVSKD